MLFRKGSEGNEGSQEEKEEKNPEEENPDLEPLTLTLEEYKALQVRLMSTF